MMNIRLCPELLHDTTDPYASSSPLSLELIANKLFSHIKPFEVRGTAA
jgi:hypothetical protein